METTGLVRLNLQHYNTAYHLLAALQQRLQELGQAAAVAQLKTFQGSLLPAHLSRVFLAAVLW